MKTNPSMVLANVSPSMGGWAFGPMSCISRLTYNPSDPNAPPNGTANCLPTNEATCATLIQQCEQSPIVPMGVAQITQAVAGGTDWPMAMATLGNGGGLDGGTLQLAGSLSVVSVTSGTTDITGLDALTTGPSLSMANGAIDPSKDLTITFSCDPNTLVAGSSCTGSGSPDLVGLFVTTSTSKKTAFSTSTATGTATCSQPVTMGGTITVTASQLTAMLGGQTGGSWQVVLVRLSTRQQSSVGSHPLLTFNAGMGVFGFTDQ
jgi:hypothetical protein